MLILPRPIVSLLALAPLACGPSAPSGEPSGASSGAEVDAEVDASVDAPDDAPDDVRQAAETSAPTLQPEQIQGHPDDPQGWVPMDQFHGLAVDVVREYHADGGLRRIVCYLAGQRVPEALHGPEWLQFKNRSPRARKVWVNGVNDGPFVAWFPSGLLKWEGSYSLGKRDGIYRQFFPNSDMHQEFHYRKGVPHGSWMEWNVGGHRAKEEHFVDGELEGVRREWGKGLNPGENPELAEEGEMVLEEQYQAGVLHGTWRDFWPDTGKLRTEGEYVAGRRVGVWRSLHEGGQQKAESRFVDGELSGIQVLWNESGNKLSEIEHLAGQPHGASRSWFADGQLQAEGRLEQGLRVGPWSYWRTDGSLNEIWTGSYEDDLRVGD